MTLTHQFLITLVLPAAFLLLLVYDWRRDGSPQYGPFWSLTLVATMLWATHLLSYYGGVALPAEIAASWRIAGRHLLGSVAVFILLSTTAYLGTARPSRLLLTGISLIFWSASFLFDPAIWPWRLPIWSFSPQENAHFDIWAAIWVTSWVIPHVAALMLTRQAARETQSALFRNRLNYWLITLLVFLLGGALALIQQPGQPAWQELGALGMVLAAFTGTTVFVRGTLPNLRLALRYVLARLAALLLILSLTWLFLFLTVRTLRTQQESTVLELGLAAAIFTALFGAVNHYVPRLVRRLFLPDGGRRSGRLAEQPALTDALSDPAALGKILLHLCQFNVATERARLWLADEAAGGNILLRSVAQIGYDDEREPIEFDADGAMISHLRRYPPTPLSSYEMTSLPAYAAMRADEKDQLRAGNTEIIIPLLAGDALVGALALGEKYTAETYNHAELNWLQDLGTQAGLLLWQSRQLHQSNTALQSVRAEMNECFREVRQLRELRALHEQFAHLISPVLRQPFQEIDQTIKQLEDADESNGAMAIFSDLNQQLAQLRLMLNNLIVNATRIRSHYGFSFQRINLLDVIDDAVRDLASMAAARQVTVTVTGNTQLPAVSGDAQRLYKAVHHLLHNAIRFNKIGGRVNVESGISGNQVYIHVKDTGIGIEQERLANIWQGPALNHDRRLKNAGAGLGLLFTRFIIRTHGGDIEASSDVDRGSTFSLYLPMAVAESLDVASA